MIELSLLEENGHVQFIIYMEEDLDYYMNFKVYQVSSWSTNDDPCQMDLYVHGTIKWDGCSHLYFGDEYQDEDGYIYLCGKYYWDLHNKMMTNLYKLASEVIVNFKE